MRPITLVPLDRMLTIAHTSVRHYCPKTHPFFSDFRQDVILAILERQYTYDSSQGSAENFIVSVARQKARSCSSAYRREERLVPHTDEVEPSKVDELLLLVQLTALLNESTMKLLTALLTQCPPNWLCPQLGITESKYYELFEELKEWADSQFFRTFFFS